MPEEQKQPAETKEEEKLLPEHAASLNHPPQEEDFADDEYFHPKMAETGEIKTLISWEAPSRPYRKKDRSYFTTIAVIVVLLILIVLLIKDFLLIAVLLSLTFVTYVLALVPPNNVKYRISTQGVIIGEDFYFWHYLDSFWFKDKEGSKVLTIETRLRFPAQLMLVLSPDQKEEEIKKTVARFLPYHEIPHKTLLDKWTEGLQKHFPLENIHH